ncbi:3-hydroxyacyl-CoA dehydrogenase family protein [Streptomyces sp. NPDC058280]|uniref:3-hydroxyacyl-CoA dehydrogenase family protein n=1 Tax=Streptomyces sp. NPDC058280 TaxID=3346419 RepID=UPI0036E9D9FA
MSVESPVLPAAPAGPVAVIGAGTMGAGLAQTAAAAGRDVILYSRTEETLARASVSIDTSLRRIARRAAARPEPGAAADPDQVRLRIALTTDLGDCGEAAVVIESIAEDLTAKRRMFAELDRICAGSALLATNTSGIPIGLVAGATSRPERVVGTHFFSPVPVMELCEIVRGPATADSTMAAARSFAREIGKQSIVVDRDSPGFVTTRLLTVLILEAIRMVEDGTCRAADIDLACRLGFGHPMGPLASVDLSGLDVFQDVASGLHRATGNPVFAVPALLGELVASGHHGRKSGRGFHDYSDADRTEGGGG